MIQMLEQAPQLGPLLAEGKTRMIYADQDDPNLAYMVSKEQITAVDDTKRDELAGKARWSTLTTANVFKLLNQENLDTAFVKQVNDTTLLVYRCTMVPLEIVMRRIATGSYLKRHPEISEGTRFEKILVETFLKDDARHNPLLSAEEVVRMGIATQAMLDWMAEQGTRVFLTLERAWASIDVTLVDLKVEFGLDTQGHLRVADVIDNDSWRLWPGGDRTRVLDKQAYRNLPQVTPPDLQAVADRDALIADLTGRLQLPED